MNSYRTILKNAERKLEENNREANSAKLLLMHISQKNMADIYADYEKEMPQNIKTEFEMGIGLLLAGYPLQHITKTEMFFGYDFYVNEDVLIPRPETEELVGQILMQIDEHFASSATLVDIGTGSGAIAISLKKEEPKLKVYATDISEKALEVAKKNAADLDADVIFLQGDMLEPLIENNIKVDFLVSNPPYIKKNAILEDVVVDHEPHVALFGGEDGLYFYRKIFEKSHLVLNKKAILAFEIGYDQKEAIMNLAKSYFPTANKIEVLKDNYGNDRMLFINLL